MTFLLLSLFAGYLVALFLPELLDLAFVVVIPRELRKGWT